MKIRPLEDPERLLSRLSENIIENAGFIFRLGDGEYHVYANEGITAALAVQRDGEHCMFWGDWHDIEMPLDALPGKGIFVSACAPDTIEVLKGHFKLDGEWPCWHYLAPDDYGPGEWDELSPLADVDAPLVAKYWELGGDDREEHIRDRVNRFDSACVRLGGKPVSWCGLHFEIGGIGNLGFAHTLDEHRRKGYASLVTKALVNRLRNRGVATTCHVIKDNKASMKLCASLGFSIVGEQTWAYFRRD